MHLENISLRGFKSFAGKSSIDLTQGITCIVGPNGSGKSNIVDAIQWVLGSLSPTQLRSSKMSDIIFSGSSTREKLGRTQVSITINNDLGELLVNQPRVTITRTLWESGASEYEINSKPCRLADVQELLSDSSIGKQMHILVSQGNLDKILSSMALDRKEIIEEAAGVYKHRMRKEKSIRKLEKAKDNLEKLNDFLILTRRQYKPLEKQAKIAGQARDLTKDLDKIKRIYSFNEYSLVQNELTTIKENNNTAKQKTKEINELLELSDVQIEKNKIKADEFSKTERNFSDLWFEFSRVQQQIQSAIELAKERQKLLKFSDLVIQEVVVTKEQKEIDQLSKKLNLQDLTTQKEKEKLNSINNKIKSANLALDAATQFHQELVQKKVNRQNKLNQLTSSIDTSKSLIIQFEESSKELNLELKTLNEQKAKISKKLSDCVQIDIEKYKNSEDLIVDPGLKLHELEQKIKATKQQIDNKHQLIEQLSALLPTTAPDFANIKGVKGVLSEFIKTKPGYEKAVNALLKQNLEALVVADENSLKEVLSIVEKLDNDFEQTVLMLDFNNDQTNNKNSLEYKAINFLEVKDSVQKLVNFLLANSLIVDDLAQAQHLVKKYPHYIVATKKGQVLNSVFARTGSSKGHLGVISQIEQEKQNLLTITQTQKAQEKDLKLEQTRVEKLQIKKQKALDLLQQKQQEFEKINIEIQNNNILNSENNAKINSVVTQIDNLKEKITHQKNSLNALLDEIKTVQTTQNTLESEKNLQNHKNALLELEKEKMQVQTEYNLSLAAQQSIQILFENAQNSLTQKLNSQVQQQQKLQKAKASFECAKKVEEIANSLEKIVVDILDSIKTNRQNVENSKNQLSNQLQELYSKKNEQVKRLAGFQEKLDPLRQTQLEIQLENIASSIKQDFAISDISDFLNENSVSKKDFENTSQQELLAQIKQLERQIKLLGAVNPFALEEFESLKKQHDLLKGQILDLEKSERDLKSLILELDNKVDTLYEQAFSDISVKFKEIISKLFPGGFGHITNELHGVEIEVKPAGKKLRKLSLLSGGERALVSLAFLFAIFASRPSPFYIMDEIEAALDEVNLGRLLSVIKELSTKSQIVLITHQRSTMETADCLYGISMNNTGVSTIVSQKVKS